MKKMIIILLFLMISGCTQQEIRQLTAEVKNLSDGVDTLQTATVQLTKDGILDSKKFDKINANIDKVQEDVKLVVAKVEEADEPVEAAKSAWDATRLWNPYWGYVAAGLAILELFRKRNKTT